MSDAPGEEVSADALPEPMRSMLAAIDPHQDHPAYQWFEMIVPGFLCPFLTGDATAGEAGEQHVYQFCRDSHHAWIWESNVGWLVKSWSQKRSAAPQRISSLRNALDELVAPPRPWWKLW